MSTFLALVRRDGAVGYRIELADLPRWTGSAATVAEALAVAQRAVWRQPAPRTARPVGAPSLVDAMTLPGVIAAATFRCGPASR